MPLGLTSGNAYLPAYVPSYVDWRHSGGYSGKKSSYDLEDLPNALSKKLDKTMQKQAVRSHSERMEYANKFKKFRKKVLEQMEEEEMRRPAVELVGKELDPDKDLIYVAYVIDENTEGKMKEIESFITDSFHKFGLGEYFRAEPEGAIPKDDPEEQPQDSGDVVVWVWPKRDHDYPEFERKQIDYWNPDDDEDDGGGGF